MTLVLIVGSWVAEMKVTNWESSPALLFFFGLISARVAVAISPNWNWRQRVQYGIEWLHSVFLLLSSRSLLSGGLVLHRAPSSNRIRELDSVHTVTSLGSFFSQLRSHSCVGFGIFFVLSLAGTFLYIFSVVYKFPCTLLR